PPRPRPLGALRPGQGEGAEEVGGTRDAPKRGNVPSHWEKTCRTDQKGTPLCSVPSWVLLAYGTLRVERRKGVPCRPPQILLSSHPRQVKSGATHHPSAVPPVAHPGVRRCWPLLAFLGLPRPLEPLGQPTGRLVLAGSEEVKEGPPGGRFF